MGAMLNKPTVTKKRGIQMKRFYSILAVLLIAILFFCLPADAKVIATQRLLDDEDGTVFTDYALTSATAVYSETILIKDNALGTAAILVTEDVTGDAGDVDINAQYSIDGTNWYSAYTTAMAGTTTVEGNIVTALGNTTEYIVFTVRIGMYLRFKFDPDADSQVTVYFIYQTDN